MGKQLSIFLKHKYTDLQVDRPDLNYFLYEEILMKKFAYSAVSKP